MLHDLTVKSAASILCALQDKLAKPVGIKDLVQPLPDDIMEQVVS